MGRRHDEATVNTHNRMRLVEIRQAAARPLLLEHGDIFFDELRKLAKTASDANWQPDKV